MAAYIGRWFPGPGNHFCKLSFSHQQNVALEPSWAHLGSSLQGSVCSCRVSPRSSSTTCTTLFCPLSTRWASPIWWPGQHQVARTCPGRRPHLQSPQGRMQSNISNGCLYSLQQRAEGRREDPGGEAKEVPSADRRLQRKV